MNAVKSLLQGTFIRVVEGKWKEVTYNSLVVNDDPAIVSDRLDKWRVSNLLIRVY